MRVAMSSPEFITSRLPAILTGLIERTESGEIKWEMAQMPSAYAVNVGDVRFRVSSATGFGKAPYILEFLAQPATPPIMTGDAPNDPVSQLIDRLYSVVRAAVVVPDPFESVEEALGLKPSKAPKTA
jgi:hypothetical protein